VKQNQKVVHKCGFRFSLLLKEASEAIRQFRSISQLFVSHQSTFCRVKRGSEKPENEIEERRKEASGTIWLLRTHLIAGVPRS